MGASPDRVVASLVTASLLCASALAATETTVSLYVGQSQALDSDLEIQQSSTNSNATFSGVSWEGQSFTTPIYWALRVTHYFEAAPHWAAGGEFVHDKVIAQTSKPVAVSGTWNGAAVSGNAPLGQYVQTFEISHGVNYVGALGVYRWMLAQDGEFANGRWQPYVAGGPVYFILHPESTVHGLTADEQLAGSGFGFEAMGGMRFLISSHWDLSLEAKYTQGTAKVDISGGTAQTDLKLMQAIFGVGFSF